MLLSSRPKRSSRDSLESRNIDHDLTKQPLPPILESGWQPVTYRQNTDLAVEAWH